MKWWPGKCRAGDMIRVKLGPLYHYGIFVSAQEVIQFGHPHRDRNAAEPGKDIRIFAGTAAEFAAGNMIEVASLSLGERLRRFSRSKTVRLARARIGENGYDILHNNCEHFANMCVFGRKICLQTDRIVEKWRTRPILDVYVCPVGECGGECSAQVGLRQEHMRRVTDPALARRKNAAWKLLEYAMLRSCGQRMGDAAFALARNGKWTCDKVCFSISHTENWVAVAVSNEDVGVDAEERDAFMKRDPAPVADMFCTGSEAAAGPGPEEMLRLWLCKESIYKRRGKGRFAPRKIPADAEPVTYLPELDGTPLALAVAGANLSRLSVYRYDQERGATPIATGSGKEKA